MTFVDYNGRGRFYLGDCLDKMKEIPDGVIDMVLADLPYGTTACKWDTIIDLELLWEQYWRVVKESAAIVLTASQPFTTTLIYQQIEYFKYEWIWNKGQPSGFPSANKMPMKLHENICVFGKNTLLYNPQKTFGNPIRKRTRTGKTADVYDGIVLPEDKSDDSRFPTSILPISKGWSPHNRPIHPTQKPVTLFEYLIKTYTNENELVLDNTAGAGTTAIAAINTNRKWVCIEKEQEYFDKAIERINEHLAGQHDGEHIEREHSN